MNEEIINNCVELLEYTTGDMDQEQADRTVGGVAMILQGVVGDMDKDESYSMEKQS